MAIIDEEMYGDGFYNHVSESGKCLDVVMSLVKDIVNPKSVVDFGCAVGRALHCFKSMGITDVFGIDGFWVKEEQLLLAKDEFMRHDLSKPLKLPRRFDLAISTEVAEHIPEENADSFIKSLTDASDIVLFGAAIPGQGGINHVNEQWPNYWINKFTQRGYEVFDCIRGQIWYNEEVDFWYKQNMFLFCKEGRISALRLPGSAPPVYDMVHPDQLTQKLYQLNYLYEQHKKVEAQLKSVQASLNHAQSVIQEPAIELTTERLDAVSERLMEFISETDHLHERVGELPFETATELYDMYEDAARVAAENIAGIEPELRVLICDIQDKILERIIDFEPVISPKDCRFVYTPAVQGYRTWGNTELMKDKGLVGYTLAKETGARPVMFFGTKPSDYPYLSDLPEMELTCSDFANGAGEVYTEHLSENYAQMDTLILHGMHAETIKYLSAYRKRRPDGRVYCGLDMNSYWMSQISWESEAAKQFAGQCDVVATSCRFMRDKLNRDSRVAFPCRWLPNGFYNPSGTKVVADTQKKENIIVTVGRIGTAQKNNEELLTAFAMASDALPGWTLRLVGGIDPEFLSVIEQFFSQRPDLKSRVVFTGAITDKDELYSEYARAKIFALTSQGEGFPNVYAEALVHGCMFVTSDIDAADDITNYGQLGVKYKLGDAEALAHALVGICRKANRTGMMRHIPQALEYAGKYYDWNRNAKKLAYMLYRT